jgi:HlyD family secretion protein
MKKKVQVIFVLSVLFMSINLFLIEKKDSKIGKIDSIKEWKEVSRGDIQETVKKDGVIVPDDEHHIYFDSTNGSFEEFLVAEGDDVSAGTPLYKYSPDNLEAEIDRLTAKKEEIEDNMESVEDHIRDLGSISSDTGISQDFEYSSSENYKQYDLEKELSKAALQKELLQSESDMLQKQIDNAESQSDSLVVSSQFDGKIKEINTSLDNPLITIVSQVPSVKGTLNEKEMEKVQDGQAVNLWSKNNTQTAAGIIESKSTIPENEPDPESPSVYPFKASIMESSDPWISGTHVGMSIVLNESKNVIIVPIKSLEKGQKEKKSIYILSPSGKTEEREVTPGLSFNGEQEIREGLEEDEIFAVRADSLSDGNKFVTPVKSSRFTKKSIAKNIKTDWTYIIKGILTK